jgi:hypothetical protein
MNCQNFENVVDDLARTQIMEAAVRDQAVRHADDCDNCSARLRTEQRLTSSLKDFATEIRSAYGAGAPARVEERLLAEFRNHSSALRVVRQVNRNYRAYAGVAALLLIVIAIVALGAFGFRTSDTPVETAKQTKPAIEKNSPIETSASVEARPIKPLDVSMKPQKKNLSRRTIPTGNRHGSNGSTLEAEIATEFFPVGYSSTLSVQDGGQVVRVEMPRSAMARFGVPVNMDRVDEKVKADVLVGSDGLARAIRFIQ